MAVPESPPVIAIGFWIKASLIATLVGPLLAFGVILATTLTDPVIASSAAEMGTILFYTYVIGLPVGGAMALVWALISWALARLIGRFVLIPSVLVGLAIPVLFLFAMNGIAAARHDRDGLVVLGLVGAFSALIGINVVLRTTGPARPKGASHD